jgi:hypothetical protein
MNTYDTFAKVLGGQPSQAEGDRRCRVCDALGLRENDASSYIVMILEHHDSLYRDYQKQIGGEAAEPLKMLGARLPLLHRRSESADDAFQTGPKNARGGSRRTSCRAPCVLRRGPAAVCKVRRRVHALARIRR